MKPLARERPLTEAENEAILGRPLAHGLTWEDYRASLAAVPVRAGETGSEETAMTAGRIGDAQLTEARARRSTAPFLPY
jgi:hypothetical protein